jgi:hypothetical protein
MRFTLEEIRNIFKERGFKLLSTEYINAHTKIEYECPKGHKNFNTYNSFRLAGGCAECSGKKKITYEYIKEFFEKENYSLLSNKDECNGTKIKVQYKCPNGHIHFMKPDHFIHSKRRCPTCAIERNSGENHYNYNPNLTDEERIEGRSNKKNEIWRKAVYKRDNYICKKCNIKHKTLNAHHIDNYSSNKKERFNLKNGITLCSDCHNMFHQIYGKENNTIVQLNEYLGSEFIPKEFDIKVFAKFQSRQVKRLFKIKKLREEGLSCDEIADKLGMKKGLIAYYLKKMGLETWNNNSKLGENKIELLRACFEEGMMPKKTADKTGINYNTIRKYFSIFKKET